jgi:hypothetical protein
MRLISLLQDLVACSATLQQRMMQSHRQPFPTVCLLAVARDIRPHLQVLLAQCLS